MEIWISLVLVGVGFCIRHWRVLDRFLYVFEQFHDLQHKETLVAVLVAIVVVFVILAGLLNKVALVERAAYRRALAAHRQSDQPLNPPRLLFRRSSFGPGHAAIIKQLIKTH
ncbi:Uncharacterized protein PBTT_01121 [Plasmodiophora brassicae]|uniref:Uncharacterized protein n=1 Tax=Plasmodiophora brassicae TaxID=37360 RepID=A0A0G4J017_PLABS|nr:hypothetical protein PBRA_001670 [Plasmodiophora brassicae]SPQ93893.1 unnamed protein product [Plasmodiophora brassicae]